MKYCDIHGEVDAKLDQAICNKCQTVLTEQPNAHWKAIYEGIYGERRKKTSDAADAFDEIRGPNARALNRKQGAFLAAFEKTGMICRAAEAAGVDQSSHYVWLKRDADYAAAYAESEVIVGNALLDEAVRRAMHGWEEPTTVAGEKVMVRKFSDRLLERLLEAHHPEKFRANLAHRLVDKKGDDRSLFAVEDLDKLIRAADERDKAESA